MKTPRDTSLSSDHKTKRHPSKPGWAATTLSESERACRDIIENVQDIVYMIDTLGTIIYLNQSFERVTGHRRDDLIGRSLLDIIVPDSLVLSIRIRERQLAGEEVGPFELSLFTADSSIITIKTRESLIRRGNRVVEIHGIGSDITEKRRTEESIRQSEERFRKLCEASRDTVFLADHTGALIDINTAGEILLGSTKKELLDVSITKLAADPESRARLKRIIEDHDIASDQGITVKKKDGPPLSCLLTTIPETDSTGVAVGFMGIIREIDGLKDFQNQTVSTQLKEIGTIAHDFKNIMATIVGYTSFLINKVSEPETIAEGLAIIENRATHASTMTARLMSILRPEKRDHDHVDANDVIKGVHAILAGTFPASIRIDLELGGGPFVVRGDQSQINQIVTNLAVNARDAMPDGGRLIITTATHDMPNGTERNGHPLKPGRYVTICVADTGTGMDREILDRALEPYFTTRRDQGRTGLGLSVVHDTVTDLHGYITIDSAKGKGTSVTVWLPISSDIKDGI